MIPKIQLNQDFDSIRAAIEKHTEILIEEHIMKNPPDDWIQNAFQAISKLWKDKGDIKELFQKEGKLSEAELVLITDNRIKGIIEGKTKRISKLSKSRKNEFLQDANKIREVLGFSPLGKACFLYYHDAALIKNGIEQALRLPDEKKKMGIRAAAEKWRKIITDESRIKRDLQKIKERSKQTSINNAVKEINVYRRALLMKDIAYEMNRLISQEEDCRLDDSISQVELINVKRLDLPEKEKQFIIDFFTKPFDPIRKKVLSPEHISLMKKAFPISEIYRALMRDNTLLTKKEKAYSIKAIRIFEKDSQKFILVKKEYLEDVQIYANFKKSSKERIWLFFGEIYNKIFKDNDLPTIDKNIIYDALRETDYWKDFANSMMKNQ